MNITEKFGLSMTILGINALFSSAVIHNSLFCIIALSVLMGGQLTFLFGKPPEKLSQK
jgi:hypothetical protein